MAEYEQEQHGKRPRIVSFEIPEHSGASGTEARDLIEEVLRGIPEDQLRNVRTGQVTLVM